MDPIITQWNSEWVTGPGGLVFLMQKENEALCMVYAPVQKNAWVTFGTRQRLAGGKSWQQIQTGVFSCRACRFLKWKRSSLLPFYTSVYWYEMSVRVCSFFSSFLFVRRGAEEQMLPFCLTLPKPLWEVCSRRVCVLLSFFHQSSAVTLN